jgi:hypothetical protein
VISNEVSYAELSMNCDFSLHWLGGVSTIVPIAQDQRITKKSVVSCGLSLATLEMPVYNSVSMADLKSPFPTIAKLAAECGASWKSFEVVAKATRKAEAILIQALKDEEKTDRILDADSSLVLCGSFARHEMVRGSDCDWTLLINGVVNNEHAQAARSIGRAIESAAKKNRCIKSPGISGTFGNMCFSHDLVHRIGGGADSNANLTRRILMLLESRPVSLSPGDSSKEIWDAVVRSILQRYFEEDAHFSPDSERKVPRFLLNDLTRYWRTIGVDYAAKYWEQDGKRWAIRNAKLRMSRKLLYAAGMAFCFACQLKPPTARKNEQVSLFGDWDEAAKDASAPFIAYAVNFAGTPPLEFLAAFVDRFITKSSKRQIVSERIFGAYDEWLALLANDDSRAVLDSLSHAEVDKNPVFQKVRKIGSQFASGLKLLFFNRDKDSDPIANLSLEYAAF